MCDNYYIPSSISDPAKVAEKYNASLPLVNNAYALLNYLKILQYPKKLENFLHKVELSAQWMRKEILSMNLSEVSSLLIRMGLLERGYSYKVKEYCKSHRLTENALITEWIEIPFKNLFGGKKQINLAAKRQRAFTKVRDLADGDLKDSILNMVEHARGLKIEESKELRELQKTEADKKYHKYEAKRGKDKIDKNGNPLPFIHYSIFFQAEVEAIRKINEADWLDFTGIGDNERLYSPLTNLARNYRKELLPYYDKGSLVNVDVRASQPSLLPLFYDESDPSHMQEKQCYVDVITSNETDIYEVIADSIDKTRDEVKVPFLQSCYGPNMISKFSKVGKAQRAAFPVLFNEILPSIRGRGKDAYKQVARRMQKVEADVFIKNVFVEFSKNNPDKPCFPIHDSFMVLPEDVKEITRLMNKHFYNVMGYNPIIKAEDSIVDLSDDSDDDFDRAMISTT